MLLYKITRPLNRMYCQICAVDLTINEAIPLCQGSDLYKKIAKCIPIVVSNFLFYFNSISMTYNVIEARDMEENVYIIGKKLADSKELIQ